MNDPGDDPALPQSGYREDEHARWKILMARCLGPGLACEAYRRGWEALEIDRDRIEPLAVISDRVHALAGWRLFPTRGLLPQRAFLHHLKAREFPVSVEMRTAAEVDFARLPDVFHDVVGHVPMLLDAQTSAFLDRYAQLGLRHAEDEAVLTWLRRFFWHALEGGLIREGGELRLLGGAILTSNAETRRALAGDLVRAGTVEQIVHTSYKHTRLLNQYFVFESMDDLHRGLDELEAVVEAHPGQHAGSGVA